MTENEWLTCGVPAKMWATVPKDGNPRKRRLYGCGCCRRIWDALTDRRSRTAVEVAERFADGFATPVALTAVRKRAEAVVRETREYDGEKGEYRFFGTFAAAAAAADDVSVPFPGWYDAAEHALALGAKWHAELEAVCGLIRCVFGNPFRPAPAVVPTWFTSTVVALAKGMYESRDFSPMPILADALQDAGCENADVLGHCRGDGPHARGCWVVDLILGKS